jgi:hypothetical protein
MKNSLPAKLQTVIVVLSIVIAYIVLHFPAAHTYSLQIFLLSVLTFFVLKRFKKAKLWHVLPDHMSVELGLVSFAFVFLIGATGNTHSLFYSLSYFHLFFLVFSSTPLTAIASIIALITFHYALEPDLAVRELGSIISLPVIGVLLLFAKKQYDEAHLQQSILEAEVKELDKTSQKEQTLEGFVERFLIPKLDFLIRLLSDPNETKETVTQQMKLVRVELDKIVGKVNAFDTKDEESK